MPIRILSQQPEGTVATTKHTVDSTKCTIDPPLAAHTDTTGTLYIAEHALVYFSSEANFGFSIDYHSIVIHAISRAEDEGEHSSLYCQLDCAFPNTQSKNDDSDDEEDEEFSELRFFPSKDSDLDTMFRVMSECAALNPDPDMEEADSEEETLPHVNDNSDDDDLGAPGTIQGIAEFDPSSFITSEDQLDQLTPEGKRTLDRLESLIVVPDNQNQDTDRFADAD